MFSISQVNISLHLNGAAMLSTRAWPVKIVERTTCVVEPRSSKQHWSYQLCVFGNHAISTITNTLIKLTILVTGHIPPVKGSLTFFKYLIHMITELNNTVQQSTDRRNTNLSISGFYIHTDPWRCVQNNMRKLKQRDHFFITELSSSIIHSPSSLMLHRLGHRIFCSYYVILTQLLRFILITTTLLFSSHLATASALSVSLDLKRADPPQNYPVFTLMKAYS